MGQNFCEWVTPKNNKATCEGKNVQQFFSSLKHDDKNDKGVCEKAAGVFKQICKDPCAEPDRQLKPVKFSDLGDFIDRHPKDHALLSFLKPADFLGQSVQSGCMGPGGGMPGPV